jgi:hypothetical protein
MAALDTRVSARVCHKIGHDQPIRGRSRADSPGSTIPAWPATGTAARADSDRAVVGTAADLVIERRLSSDRLQHRTRPARPLTSGAGQCSTEASRAASSHRRWRRSAAWSGRLRKRSVHALTPFALAETGLSFFDERAPSLTASSLRHTRSVAGRLRPTRDWRLTAARSRGHTQIPGLRWRVSSTAARSRGRTSNGDLRRRFWPHRARRAAVVLFPPLQLSRLFLVLRGRAAPCRSWVSVAE